MREKERLHFGGINILSAANDHVLGSAPDMEMPVLAHDSQVAGVQPALAIDSFRSGLRVLIVSLHHQVSASAKFPHFTQRNRRAGGADKFHLRIGHSLANGGTS